MRHEIILLALLLFILALGLSLHRVYLGRIKARVMETAGSDFGEEDLKSILHMPQGSNFNTAMLSCWSLYFVALVFLYFLTPQIFPSWNYFRLSTVASSYFGPIILASGTVVITGAAAFNIPKIYRYYEIGKDQKEMMVILVPVLLLISLACSLYTGIIYPDTNISFWNLGYAALFLGQMLLLLPVFSGFAGGMR
ncbi:MAG: hypothetical protein HPY61_03690 [Methanotrichaceae archaeon]|nr:hypothetical protein [Methanotrichaceae archaeon]